MQTKKLTGWLILLIVWIGVLGLSGGFQALGQVADSYKPYFSQYPSLSLAIMLFQVVVGAGIAAWGYTAWVIYRREPGTLVRAQTALLVGGLLRAFGWFCIPIFGGLPPSESQLLVQQSVGIAVFIVLFTVIWHQYLARSKKVREIFAEI